MFMEFIFRVVLFRIASFVATNQLISNTLRRCIIIGEHNGKGNTHSRDKKQSYTKEGKKTIRFLCQLLLSCLWSINECMHREGEKVQHQKGGWE